MNIVDMTVGTKILSYVKCLDMFG